jgi:hypothetical protein
MIRVNEIEQGPVQGGIVQSTGTILAASSLLQIVPRLPFSKSNDAPAPEPLAP